jgi:spore coat protein JB
MKNMNQKQLMNYISAVGLALDDVTLFLDTHPNNPEALTFYNNCKEMRMQAMSDYNRFYGPLTRFNVNSGNEWKWTQGPWPWQGEV